MTGQFKREWTLTVRDADGGEKLYRVDVTYVPDGEGRPEAKVYANVTEQGAERPAFTATRGTPAAVFQFPDRTDKGRVKGFTVTEDFGATPAVGRDRTLKGALDDFGSKVAQEFLNDMRQARAAERKREARYLAASDAALADWAAEGDEEAATYLAERG